MEFLTTTDLRTQSVHLVQLLKKGTSVSLVHRSQVIGLIAPQQAPPRVLTDPTKLARLLAQMKPEKTLTKAQREKIYFAHLAQKYG